MQDKEKWIKPELIVLAKGNLGENVLSGCPAQDEQGNWSTSPEGGS